MPRASLRRIALPALDDPDPDVRIAALDALIEDRVDGLGRRVISWLGDPDARIRRAAAAALARDPVNDAVGALGRILGDQEPSVRVAAARALGASGAKSAVVPLLGRLDDTDADVREAVTTALARIGDLGAVVPLVGKSQDPRPGVRRSVAMALGELGDARAASALTLMLRDPDENVRIAVLTALSRLHAEEAVGTIVALLAEERRPLVRQAALAALGSIPSQAGLDALVQTLRGDDPRAASPGRAALVHAGDRAVPTLIECVRVRSAFDRTDGCVLALGEIGTQAAVDAVADGLRRGAVKTEIALDAIGRSRDSRELGLVLESLRSDDPRVRHAAVDAATALLEPEVPDGRAVEPILRALDAAHARRAERASLVALLGRTGSPRAIPVLSALTRDATDTSLRLVAIQALGFLGRSGQDAPLLAALDDEHAAVRRAAALSLRRTASAATAGLLLDRFERSADQDRGAIGVALVGALSATEDRRVVNRALSLIPVATGADADALIEALGAVGGALGSDALIRLLPGADTPTRAKIAEALAAHPEALTTLLLLARDNDASVRANAVWSLGAAGGAEQVPLIASLLFDTNVAVGGDSAASLGRLGARGVPVTKQLCASLDSDREYVRVNALAGLLASRSRCPSAERSLLARDPAVLVRREAARLIHTVPSLDVRQDAAALSRCAVEEGTTSVAAYCADSSAPLPSKFAPLSVYVVPEGESEPAPLAPFALVRADGFVRLGLTDRRGSVYEFAAPAGPVRLAVPAPLAF